MRQVLRAGALEKTQRDWVEREVGGGIGMGNTCKRKKKKFLLQNVKKKKKNAMLSFNSKNGHLEMYKMELRFLQ